MPGSNLVPFSFPNHGWQSNSTQQFEKQIPFFKPQMYAPNTDCCCCGKHGHRIADCREKCCANHARFGHSTQECRLAKFATFINCAGTIHASAFKNFVSLGIPEFSKQQTLSGNVHGKHKRKVHFTLDPAYQWQGSHSHL